MSILYPDDQHIYSEDSWDELGVKYIWKNTKVDHSFISSRGTLVEMIYKPHWGLSCYMENAIQSCEVDEKLYHEALVHPAMSTVEAKRVMIIGGGEGATAREVLKWPTVKHVDMYEWDKDVVDLFKAKYPQWAKGAWEDTRLHLHYDDIFEVIMKPPVEPYDVIIVDLFDPCEENTVQWYLLLKSIHKWIREKGSIVIYSGMRNILHKTQPYHILQKIIDEHLEYSHMHNDRPILYNPVLFNREIEPYKVYIPSFSGESTFLLIRYIGSTCKFTVPSHLSDSIWKSYQVFNW